MERNTAAVMGGSFNPPTAAHLLLMRAAMEAVNADRGIFVPVSDAYLRRKLKNDDTKRIRFPFARRVEFVSAMCASDPRISVSEIEREEPVSSVYRMLSVMQAASPDTFFFFAAGADKLPVLEGVASHTDLTQRFGLLLFGRDGASPEALLREYPKLYEKRENVRFITPPGAAFGVSSTAIRRRILAGEAPGEGIPPEVEELLRGVRPSDFPEEIAGFTGEYAFLDNRSPAPLVFEGGAYPSAEAAFQASKTADPNRRRAFQAYTGDRARERGSLITPETGWEDRQAQIMREILSAKFRQNPALAEKLLATGDALLLNLTGKKSPLWGMDRYTYAGENLLGQLLMRLREEMKEEV